MLAWRRRGQGARQHDHHGVEDAAEGAVDGSGNSALRPVRVADAVGGERGRGGDVENALEEAGRVDGGLVDVDAEDKPSPGQGETLGGRHVADKKAELILLNSRAVQTSIVHNKVRQGVVDGERDGAVGYSAVGRGGREIIAERKPRGVEWLRAEEVPVRKAQTILYPAENSGYLLGYALSALQLLRDGYSNAISSFFQFPIFLRNIKRQPIWFVSIYDNGLRLRVRLLCSLC